MSAYFFPQWQDRVSLQVELTKPKLGVMRKWHKGDEDQCFNAASIHHESFKRHRSRGTIPPYSATFRTTQVVGYYNKYVGTMAMDGPRAGSLATVLQDRFLRL